MNSIKLFINFVKVSYQDVLNNFGLFIPSYVAFLFVDFLASIPWRGMGYEENSFGEIILSIIIGVISLVIIVNVVMIEKSRIKHKDKEPLMYAAPTYLIYTLYSSIIIVAGLLCFVVPGIIAAVVVGMVPLASVLIDNDSINYFKISYRMARKDAVLIICYGLSSLIIEAPSFAFDFISEWRIKLGFSILYSFFDAFLMIVLTTASVRIFYHLKRLLNDPS